MTIIMTARILVLGDCTMPVCGQQVGPQVDASDTTRQQELATQQTQKLAAQAEGATGIYKLNNI